MTANCLLSGSPTLGWHLGVVVLDVVRGERVLDYLMFNILHVMTFVEECKRGARVDPM
jgi:zinc transporter ZupT